MTNQYLAAGKPGRFPGSGTVKVFTSSTTRHFGFSLLKFILLELARLVREVRRRHRLAVAKVSSEVPGIGSIPPSSGST